MKTTTRLVPIVLAAVLGATVWASAAEDAKTKPTYRTSVVFFEADKFTDVRDSSAATEKGRDAILDQLKTYLQQRAQAYVAEGQRLVVTITDIDLAGDFEPWRGGSMRDVRIVKDIYPPRINLAFKLTDADGETIKAAERELRDLAFQQTAAPTGSLDPLRYEKALLDSWLRTEFAPSKKN